MTEEAVETTAKNRVNGRFVKGGGGGGRKPRGAVNKITRDLKDGVLEAAISLGEDGKGNGGLVGYLKMLARKYPKQFSSLLARLMPLQVNGNLAAFIGAVNITPVPNGKFVSPEEAIAQMQPAGDAIILEFPNQYPAIEGEVQHDDEREQEV